MSMTGNTEYRITRETNIKDTYDVFTETLDLHRYQKITQDTYEIDKKNGNGEGHIFWIYICGKAAIWYGCDVVDVSKALA